MQWLIVRVEQYAIKKCKNSGVEGSMPMQAKKLQLGIGSNRWGAKLHSNTTIGQNIARICLNRQGKHFSIDGYKRQNPKSNIVPIIGHKYNINYI